VSSTVVSRGTSKPAIFAIWQGSRPTMSALTRRPRTTIFASFSRCSGVHQCARLRVNSARTSASMAVSITTDCSLAQIVLLSNIWLPTMARTACRTSAVRSMKAGALPGPTP
jgi:hypothetical protein